MISFSNSLSRRGGMLIQVRGVLVHTMSGTELSRVRTEFRLRLPEPINKSPLESREPTLLCNDVSYQHSRHPTCAFERGSEMSQLAQVIAENANRAELLLTRAGRHL